MNKATKWSFAVLAVFGAIAVAFVLLTPHGSDAQLGLDLKLLRGLKPSGSGSFTDASNHIVEVDYELPLGYEDAKKALAREVAPGAPFPGSRSPYRELQFSYQVPRNGPDDIVLLGLVRESPTRTKLMISGTVPPSLMERIAGWFDHSVHRR